jgi:hypothetical protein
MGANRAWPRPWTLPLIIAACGPSGPMEDRGTDVTSASSDGSTFPTSDGVATVAEPAPEDDSTSEDLTSTDAETAGSDLDCETSDPEAGCPAGCVQELAYPESNWLCDVAVESGKTVCVAEGASLDPKHPSVWWKELDGEPYFLLKGHNCVEPIAAHPVGWHECYGLPDEPPPCQCLCTQGLCRGEDDVVLIESCTMDAPCPSARLNYDGPPPPELLCMFAALRDRRPGLYEPRFDYVNDGTDWLLLVSEEGTAQALSRSWGGFPCPTSLHGTWTHSRSCELASSEYFAECESSPDSCTPSATSLDPWLVDCVDVPATCP